jgi:hypothetical protein
MNQQFFLTWAWEVENNFTQFYLLVYSQQNKNIKNWLLLWLQSWFGDLIFIIFALAAAIFFYKN